ncbi:MAG: DUF1287 domain-containing protein [Xanthomonadales bacterium]|jgi:uncharacterized protein YijF (DUF1287 family)|nr:DUF1287 domain-containing protein [Xanthomonadales bacterium]
MKLLFAAIVFFSLPVAAIADSFEQALATAALERTTHSVRYDGSYMTIAYPGGDVPADVGVCTDVVIRAYRATGTDLQQLVHEDMSENFERYPSKRIWGLQEPDSNIDHRRVPNLQVFFKRHGTDLPVSDRADAFLPGDIVTWTLPGNLPHIGIVSDRVDPASGRRMVVHNIGAGPVLEDMLFKYPVTGHYRYIPD